MRKVLMLVGLLILLAVAYGVSSFVAQVQPNADQQPLQERLTAYCLGEFAPDPDAQLIEFCARWSSMTLADQRAQIDACAQRAPVLAAPFVECLRAEQIRPV